MRNEIADYFTLMTQRGAAEAYSAALNAGLLDALDDAPHRGEALAARCDCDPESTAILLDALEAMGVATADDDNGTRRLTPLGAALVGGPYRELGGPYWRHLARWLRTGEPIATMDALADSEAAYQQQAGALGWMLAPAAAAAAQRLAPVIAGVQSPHILDVGAGSAVWGLSLAATHPSAVVTACDWPGVLPIARANAERLGLAARLRELPGDLHTVALPDAAYDVVLVANVTHLLDAEACSALFARLARTLKPGGRVVMVDVIPSANDATPDDLPGALYRLGLALRTRSGRLHDTAALTGWLGDAGLEPGEVEKIATPPHALSMLAAAR